jgi:hypothetical protein
MSSLQDFFAAMYHGAAHVYHEILQVESQVMNWTAENPALAPFVNKAIGIGAQFLNSHGIPNNVVEVGVPAVLSALRILASADATVPSIPTSTSTLSTNPK